MDEFWQQRLLTGFGDDVLQLYQTLWYAWTWLSRQSISPSTDNNVHDSHENTCPRVDQEMADVDSIDAGANSETSYPMDCFCTSTMGQLDSPHLTKVQHRIEYNRKKRQERKFGERVIKPGVDAIGCPLCRGRFNRSGLVTHL